jgi:long-chain acyl-CoA synthetase
MADHLVEMLRLADAAAPFITDLRTGQCWTYRDLRHGSLKLGAMLREHGVVAGDRVAFLTKNDPVFFPLLFACAGTGAILVPINRDDIRSDIEAVIADASPALVVYDESLVSPIPGAPIAWPHNDPPAAEVDLVAAAAPRCDNVLIIYTSGTTGSAKGVTLTHRNLTSMARTFVTFYQLRSGQRFLSILPFYHINAPMITGLVCIAAGAHVHLSDPYGFTNARAIFDMVEANRLNVLSLTPSIMSSLIQLHPHGTTRDLSSLEFCFCGTAPLPEPLWRKFEELFRVPVYQGYGLTETTTWATMTPPDSRKRYDSAGIPVDCTIRIDGETRGEVLIKGDIVMSGYWNKKGLTRQQLREGWYYSGDIGYLDNDGQLVIAGRIKNIIKRRGRLIHPEEIDSCLRQSGLVADSCTVGVADELAGERVVSACVLSQGSTDDLRRHLAQRLSPYMQPDEVVPVHAIPRNAVGKSLAGKVRDMVSGELTERLIQMLERSKVRRAPSERIGDIRSIIQAGVLAGTPITFSGLWGVGARTELAAPDRCAIGRLAELRDEMNATIDAPQVGILLVLADMHGHCNRIPEQHISEYFGLIRQLAAASGLQTRRLSDVWTAAGLSEADIARLAACPETIQAWKAFPLRDDFLKQASKRSGSDNLSEEYAFRYYCTCCVERAALTKALAGTIFFTYNDPKFHPVMPDLPTVFWHSTKPGTSAKPWFM